MATRSTAAMLGLTVDTTPCPASPADSPSPRPDNAPARPPVSPITPTTPSAAVAQPAALDNFNSLEACPAVAISESDNADAIALRSAISLLQLQREQSQRHLHALQALKTAAVSNPEAFARSLQHQRALPSSHSDRHRLAPTLAGLVDRQSGQSGQSEQHVVDGPPDYPAAPAMPLIPQPQSIVRCPPVNWAKYHVVGEALDRLHDKQNKWPVAAEPPSATLGMRPPPHAVAASYSPFTDALSPPPPPPPATTTQAAKGHSRSQAI